MERPLSPLLYAGFAVASIGGPAALAVLLLPAALGSTVASAGLIALAGGLLALLPVAVWCAYSRRVVSDGGLYAFVEAAAGRRVARIQGAIWTISYLLYLPYTITYVVYDVLPAGFPGITPYRGWLEVALPVALVVGLVAAERAVLWLTAAVGLVQLVVVAVLAAAVAGHAGAPDSALVAHGAARPLVEGGVNVGLLFVCGSLPLFLAGEVTGGGRTVRRTLIGSTVAVGAVTVAAAVPLAAYSGADLGALAAPGYTIALEARGAGLADAVLVAAAVGTLGLVVAEFVAVTRICRAAIGLPVAHGRRLVGAAFVAADVVSLADPSRFYDWLLRPSLVCLFASQLIVFAVYPRFARLHLPGRAAAHWAAAGGAGAMMLWGLWTALGQATS